MKVPFSRTVKKTSELGVEKTIYSFLAATLRYIFHLSKRFPKETVIVKLHNGNKMLIQPKRRIEDIHRDLFLYRIREPYPTAYLMASGILQKGDVVLDIGANIGYYALIEARIVGEEGCVYAVEPVEQNLMFLKANVTLNRYNNIKIFQIAFGDYIGKAEIHIAEIGNWSSMIRNPTTKYVGKQEIDITTVDAFLSDKRAPRFIRMDVEGYEYEILKGMEKTLKHVSPLSLFIEVHNFILGNKKVEEILDMLECNNFKVKFAAYCPFAMEHVAIIKLRCKMGEARFRVYDISFEQLKELCRTAPVLHVIFSKEEK